MKLNLNGNSITPWLFDVRLWIFVLFLIRLENIDLPPLDEHDWRETITLGVARNYLEVNSNFFEPRTVICDSREGIIAQEFPLFNYSIAMLWKIAGEQNWCFRLFNLIIASLGLFYFSKFASHFIGDKGALVATVIFGVSVAFMYARKGMPDVFAVSLTLIGVEFGRRYLKEKKFGQLGLFLLFVSLGMLCKMPAACVMGLLAAPFFTIETEKRIKLQFVGASVMAFILMAAWYFVWVPWAERTYGFPLFYATSLAEGWQQLVAMKDDAISRFYPIALTSRLAFLFCVVGLVWMIWKKNKPLLWAFVASTLLLFGLMLKAGGTFFGHVYYIIPFVPMMAMLAGYGLNESIKNKWLQLVILLAITIEAVVKHKPDFFIPQDNKRFIKLEKIVDQYVPEDDRILVNNREGSPVMMYFAHRRGWTVTDRMKDSVWVAGESTVGMKYLVIDRSLWKDTLPFPRLYEDNEFQIYSTKSVNE